MAEQFHARIAGGCHCGNIAITFDISRPLESLGLRACQCSFCRAHGARTTSDPDGAMRVLIKDRNLLQLYRFGLKTADFLICRGCGVFVGAVMEDGGRRFMTVNANTFRPPPRFDIAGTANDFGAEDASGRTGRRAAKWTPVTEYFE
jgi:hypothetical protein